MFLNVARAILVQYIIVLGYITAQSRVSCDACVAEAALVCDLGCMRL